MRHSPLLLALAATLAHPASGSVRGLPGGAEWAGAGRSPDPPAPVRAPAFAPSAAASWGVAPSPSRIRQIRQTAPDDTVFVRLLARRLAAPGDAPPLPGPLPLDAFGGRSSRSDATAPRARLGLRPLALPGIERPAVLDGTPPPLRRRTAWLREHRRLESAWSPTHDALLTAAVRERVRRYGRPAGDLGFLPPAEEGREGLIDRVRAGGERADTSTTAGEIGAFVSDYADLSMRVQTRAEVGGDWTRFEPCQDQFQASCNPSLLPQLQPDLRFDVQVSGTIADRIHVDVDFDQMREFEAANRINLYYEGEPDDVFRRIEVGDVTFDLPPSRFLTQGLPAGNFGFQAEGQLGPLDFQAVWAEQRGDLSSRVFRLEDVAGQRRFVQEDTVTLDDADYARGQFFFLVPPEEIVDFPHIDVLGLDAGRAPSRVVPGIEPVQLYRFEADPIARQQVEGFIQADAVLEKEGDRVTESGWFRYLQPGVDYFVHPSGLWVILRNPLSREEMLAVTYVTAAGDTIGDYNPERIYAAGGRPELRLLKASGGLHQPDRPTWLQEMHNVYRVTTASDVDPASVGVTLSVGEPSAGRTFVRTPRGDDVTFLQLLGLDRESPADRVDPAVIYSPGRDLLGGPAAVQGTFVVFPTLEPFKAPPPSPGLGLTAADAKALLAENANGKIYDDLDPFERRNGGRFRITIPFRRRSEGVITSFSLGALGIRDGSERIFFGERLLVRGTDYEIDYDVGQVRLLEPQVLFAADPDASVRATWEQKQIFRTAPISVFGFRGSSRLGDAGTLNLIGVFRNEKTLVNRPTLGLEPGAVGLAGASLQLDGDAPWLDRLLDRVPGLRYSGESAFSIDGEAALSLPNPNTRDAVFLDDFDASDERPLSLLAFDWTRGSAPASRAGAETAFPTALDETTLARLVWQHTWIVESVTGDSVGIHEGFFPRQDIDGQIRVAGSSVREPGLRMTFDPRFAPGAGSGPGFASITTTLSQTGTDLTKSEFIEFYARGGTGHTLVLDLGLASEDALFVDEDGNTSGTKSNGVPFGLGLLDQEADPARGEVWGDEADRRGVWGESCLAEPGQIYRVGDPRAVCTRGNGRQDTEDLDGDGNLDTRERHLRFVVDLGPTSPFLARSLAETGTAFRLYRIPLEDLRAVEVGGDFTEADLRNVRHLRLTLAGRGRADVTLARLRIIGSRWIKRAEDGVLAGIIGEDPVPLGRVEVTPVSRLTEGDAYNSPPGVLEELADPTSQFGAQGLEFNEKSLALRFEELPAGDRVEVYNRFPQRPRNFLDYREARLWVVARDGDFGVEEPHFFFFKVGTDTENFYLYRTPLPAPPSGGVGTTDWLPEVVVDFEEWIDLRRRAESVLAQRPRGPGDPPLQLWSADSTYAVVLRDRGRAPNLAAVREMSAGVWNEGSVPLDGEVWIDELRLSASVTDAGFAGFVNASLSAADVLDTRVTWSGRGAFFRQLEEAPSYQTDRTLSVSSRMRLERFLPADLGVEIPLRVSYDRADRDPTFLASSDVRADRLDRLRDAGTRRTRVSLGFRKRTPTADPILSVLVDGLEADVGWFRSEASTVTTRIESRGVDARIGWSRRLDRRTVDIFPGFLGDVVRWLLPGGVGESVADAELRWTPERFSLGASWLRHENDIFRFERIFELRSDTLVRPTPAPREAMETAAELRLRPFDALTADFTLLSTRDLLDPSEVVPEREVQRLLEKERSSVAGLDLGWETNRVLRTRIGFRPRFVSWLRHDVDVSTSYTTDRNATFVERLVAESGADSLLLQRNASGDRSVQASVTWDPGEMAAALLDGGTAEEGGGGTRNGLGAGESLRSSGDGAPALFRAALQALAFLLPVDFDWSDGLFSRFNRDPVGPSFGYQLGLGGARDFRFLDRDTAATLTDRRSWRVGSGLALPAGLELGVDYATSDVATLDTRSDRTLRSETWPDVRLTGGGRIGGPQSPLERLTVSAGVRRERRETSFGAEASQLRTEEATTFPWEVRVGWAGAVSLLYGGSVLRGEGVDPTGDTERDSELHRVSFSSSFLPPAFLAGRSLTRPITLRVNAAYTAESECRVVRFREACVAFVDRITRALSATLGTAVSGFEVGFQASFTDRQSFVGRREGSTQFQLGLFGQFLFEAGPPRGGFLDASQ